MSKLKARQIIPGWPRGRSTMNPYPDLMLVPFRYLVRRTRHCICCGAPRVLNHFERCSELEEEKFLAEARENRAYHQAQAEMLDTWRRMQSDGSIVAVRGGFAPSYYVEMQRYEQGMMEYYQRMLTPTFIYDRNRLKRRVTPLGSSPGR